ncbi:unnamed protein product [Leuciscus chuanchicus]
MLCEPRSLLLSYLERLGFRNNLAKSSLPSSQKISFLGAVFDSVLIRAWLSPECSLKIQLWHLGGPPGFTSWEWIWDGSPESGHDGCLQHGLRCPGAQSFSARPERPLRLGPVRQHDGGRLHKPPRRPEVAPSEKIGETPPPLGTYSEGSSHARQAEPGCGHAVPELGDSRGLETSPPDRDPGISSPRQGAQSGTPSWSYRAFMCGPLIGGFRPIAECAKYHFGEQLDDGWTLSTLKVSVDKQLLHLLCPFTLRQVPLPIIPLSRAPTVVGIRIGTPSLGPLLCL